jgi:N-acetylmuramic acid 6-phosphate etherase
MPADPHLTPFLETEQVNPATSDIDRMSPLQIAQVMNAEDTKVAAAVAQELPNIARAIEAIAARLQGGGRLIYLGAGTSGRLGVLDASECPATFNTPSELVIGWVAGGPDMLSTSDEAVEDRADLGRADAERLGVGAKDVLVGIAASGRTPYVLGAVEYARALGALTVGLTCNPDTPLAMMCAVTIAPVVGPEVISGSTRLKAGTAQKMVLNMLSTGAMVLLGKTFGNLMVDVHATNDKLRRRALAIVRRATGLDEQMAADVLHASDGEARVAIVAGCAGIAPAAARERLSQHAGSVRAALDGLL